MKKRFLKSLFPSEESIEALDQYKREQVPYLVYINFGFFWLFVLMGVSLLIGHYTLIGIITLFATLLNIGPAVCLKKNKIEFSSQLMTGVLIFLCGVFVFMAPVFDTNLVGYRNMLFIVVMAIVNLLTSFKKRQILEFSGVTFVIWMIGIFTKFHVLMVKRPASFASNMTICTLAFILANVAIILFNNYNKKMIKRANAKEEEAEAALEKITRVFNESKAGLDIGQQLTASAESAQSSVNQQSVSLTQTSTAMTQISGGLSSISNIANKQHEGINSTVQNLDAQKRLLEKLVQQVEKLKVSSEHISNFVETINTISAQTNLLAMNASIEAAHAGESGKGFAVISAEIRKLSEETTKSAERIEENLVENAEIVQETADAVKDFAVVTEKSSSELKETMNAIEKILGGISEMDEGTRAITYSLKNVVEIANVNTAKVESVTREVNNQESALEQIMEFSTGLMTRTAELEQLLICIQDAISIIEKQADENHMVTQKITKAFS